MTLYAASSRCLGHRIVIILPDKLDIYQTFEAGEGPTTVKYWTLVPIRVFLPVGAENLLPPGRMLR